MKALSFFLILFLGAMTAQGQDKKDRPSPPRSASAELASGEVVIDYSSPGVNDRVIWGELVPYDKIWRTGANEATTIMLENDMKIEGKMIPAGKYALFTIPGKDEWTVVLNEEWDQWGAYNYNQSKDVHRFTVKPRMVEENQERLAFDISDGGLVVMKWEKLELPFQIE